MTCRNCFEQFDPIDPPDTEKRGLVGRMARHNAVRRAGGSPREAIHAYCQGNKWLMENARAVGNLPPGC